MAFLGYWWLFAEIICGIWIGWRNWDLLCDWGRNREWDTRRIGLSGVAGWWRVREGIWPVNPITIINWRFLKFVLSLISLSGYNFSPADLVDDSSKILTYHRIVEAYKFAYAKRSNLGDEDFVDVTEVCDSLMNNSVSHVLHQLRHTWMIWWCARYDIVLEEQALFSLFPKRLLFCSEHDHRRRLVQNIGGARDPDNRR